MEELRAALQFARLKVQPKIFEIFGSIWVGIRSLAQRRKECPERCRRDAKYAKVPQIPLFPPLSKGDERGFLDFFAAWRPFDFAQGMLGAINFVELVLSNI